MPQGLFDRLQAMGNLPTPPGVVLQLLNLTGREDVSVAEIAGTLGRDPALAVKILRFANSPMAGMPHEVTSLDRAVALMGIRGVKMIALSFAVLGSGSTQACRGFDRQQFSLQSIACAVAARLLASAKNFTSPQDAFVAGLVSQIGRVVLATGAPEEYANVLALAHQIPGDLPPLETAVWGEAYPSIGAKLLRLWGLPESLCSAVAGFREAGAGREMLPVAKILRVAEVAAGVLCPDADDNHPGAQDFVEAAHKFLGIEIGRCAELMDQIAKEIEATRGMLEIPKGRMRPLEDIQAEVRDRIAELSLAMHFEHQTTLLQQEDLMRRATTDALTRVGNRVAFDARLALELERSARSGTPLSLFMIDVDKFKTFNDTYGHQAGDRVLQAVARALDSTIRKVDYVARYGGEEFVVIAPDASAQGASYLAERLRQAVEETSVPWEDEELGVTVSIGAAVFTKGTGEVGAHSTIKAADEQLYAAKRAGRNCVQIAIDGKPVDHIALVQTA